MSAPENLYELGRARQIARAEKNFALADQLRDQIAQAGFEIIDVADGFELHKKSLIQTFTDIHKLKNLPKTDRAITVAIIVNGFHEDAISSVNSIKDHSSAEIVLLATESAEDLATIVDSHTHVLHVAQNPGWENVLMLYCELLQLNMWSSWIHPRHLPPMQLRQYFMNYRKRSLLLLAGVEV